MKVECRSAADVRKALTGPTPDDGRGHLVMKGWGNVALSDEQAAELAAAIRHCEWLSGVYTPKSYLGQRWGVVLAAIGQNPNISQLDLSNSKIEGPAGQQFAAALKGHPNLEHLDFEDNLLDEASLEQLCAAVLECVKPAKKFLLSCNTLAPLTARSLSTLSKIRARSPTCLFGSGPTGHVISCRIATAAIQNEAARQAVIASQRALLIAFEQSRDDDKAAALAELRDTAAPEQARLLNLVRYFVHDKYATVGGFECLVGIDGAPPFFETFESSDNRQPVPADLLPSAEKSVRFILAKAKTQQSVLEELVSFVTYTIGILKNPADVTTSTDELVGDFGLANIAIDAPCYEMHHADEVRRFEFVCFEGERPAFRSNDGSRFIYTNPTTGGWRYGPTLGSEGCIWTGSEGLLESAQWTKTGTGAPINPPPAITKSTESISLRDRIVDFLEKRKRDSVFRSMLGLGDELVATSVGPPKSFPRALDKVAAAAKWKPTPGDATFLVDVNRATLIFDSPSLLALAFYLIKHKVELRGGAITRVSNYFVGREGAAVKDFKQPPCIHLNVKIDDWVHEIMLMFRDISEAKHKLHKYYELVRADEGTEVLMPIFE